LRIERAIEENTGIFSRVTVITGDQVAVAVAKNPLAKIAVDHARLLVAVPADLAGLKTIRELPGNWERDVMVVGERVAWVWSPNGTLESQALAAVNKFLKDAVTVRNLATMMKIDAVCRALAST
jgi:uncharacterized protein (DUF1697 family)